MNPDIATIPNRIFEVAIGALAQANQHAVYYDAGLEHWRDMAVLNAATAGELFLKAIIAKEHPLLIFRDLFHLDNNSAIDLDIRTVIENGRTYNFEHLPKLLWVTTGERIPDGKVFEELRKARNSIQHFCSPRETLDLGDLALNFIYKNIDPLIKKHFDINAIEYHEDMSVGYDYVVENIMKRELLFSVPSDFQITEFDFQKELSERSKKYRNALRRRFEDAKIDITAI